MQDVYIVGVGMTHFGRHLDQTEKQLTAQAVEDALRDAGCDRKRVGAAFHGNCGQGYMQGQHMVRGQVALLPLGLQGIPVTNVENACATASTAFHMALAYVRAGNADVALAVGTEKMYSTDRAKMFGVFDSGWDLDLVEQTRAGFAAMGEGVELPEGSTSPRPTARSWTSTPASHAATSAASASRSGSWRSSRRRTTRTRSTIRARSLRGDDRRRSAWRPRQSPTR